jgi:hypothetical protein
VRWSSAAFSIERFAFPVVADGVLYVAGSPGILAFDATGAACSTPTNCGAVAMITAPGDLSWGNVAIADGRAYAFSTETSTSFATGTALAFELCPQCLF